MKLTGTGPTGRMYPSGLCFPGRFLISLSSLSEVDDDFEVGEVPLDEVAA